MEMIKAFNEVYGDVKINGFKFVIRRIRVRSKEIILIFEVYKDFGGWLKRLRTYDIVVKKGLNTDAFGKAVMEAIASGKKKEFYERFFRWLDLEEKLMEMFFEVETEEGDLFGVDADNMTQEGVDADNMTKG